MSAAQLELKSVEKVFGDAVAVHPTDLEVHDGEFLSIIGPSGCGKTTTLRMIAGLESPSGGRISFEGKDITAVPPHRREFGMVFQKFALFPHMDVAANIAYGLKLRKVSKREIGTRVDEMLERVGLTAFKHRSVTTLSGGQQQRVGIARALITKPRVVLLDEPTGALDAKLQLAMQSQLKQLQRDLGLTFIHVTHNQSEALAIADRVVVMNVGSIEQVGRPQEVFERPQTRHVAEFVGRNNILDGTVSADESTFSCALGELPLATPWAAGPATAVLRADAISVHPGEGYTHRAEVELQALEYTGARVSWFTSADGCDITIDVSARATQSVAPELGNRYPIWLRPGELHLIDDHHTR
ncbi:MULTISPECIES: ABC transporter ATP-binding protein [unclassified Nocardioides]|uniref:ABC transporter ATP-binding protein n=1 Tax=unclassified Nocardioides TaxID=2615069 RepID=UPI0009F05C8B|nr:MULTISPECIES: ABC transporter ATP-binding protein [unclassified Nocardioides]GAW49099.1 Polyamine ABC transporter, ATP-binding protein [Nocardioides sp. PD653-B2]GAW56742.1 Polyamine ABC transporter, ATP-binding protein [Nocardioides sp. PD653]